MAKRTAVERFWPKVDKNGPVPEYRPDLGPCWLWTASIDIGGYGTFFGPTRRLMKAHRYAYELLVGLVPEGLQLDHLCRVRHCVNPAHLEPVTQAENTRRGRAGSLQPRRTRCPHGHPYSGDNVYTDPTGAVRCRTCARISKRRWKARLRSRGPRSVPDAH